MAVEPTLESLIRAAIVTTIQNAAGAGQVYNRLRIPANALLAELNILSTDDVNRINVVFVRRVSFTDQVSSFDDPISTSETYELWFYRGIVDATDGTDSENALQNFIEYTRDAFRTNKNIG